MSLHASLTSNKSRIFSSECDACTHVNEIRLYCVNCNETVCDSCLINGSHRNHRYLTLQDAVKNQLEKIKDQSKKVKTNVKKFHDINEIVLRAEKEVQLMYDKTKKNITAQYSELQTLLEQNHEQAFLLLEAERGSVEYTLSRLAEDGDCYQQYSMDMQENIKTLRMKEKTESPTSLLEEINALEMSLETMEEYYFTLNEKLNSHGVRLKAMQDSVQKLFKKNEKILPRPWEFSKAITFDPDEKHKDLTISEDKTQVFLRGSSTKHSKDRRAASANILASQSFTTGKHYWEVDVGGSQNWSVGVAVHNKIKNGVDYYLGNNKRSWVLESDEGDLRARHDNNVSIVKEASVQRLGVFVDCDKGRVRFYDVSTGNVLHTFIIRFKGAVCPAFSLRDQAYSTAQLHICRLTPRDVHYASREGSIDSGTYDMNDVGHRGSTDTSL
ncbi:tripartite motif-containing protein 75-like [Electrophorus electricus]|uniref:tripartite motif-containing protein 75-like n=1 Tax=Electrophorus electricus TaxID=8005 RepID=UPI0015D075E9|nr:tripartite motif-containing protein 75-like [Electrophorus electricus]